MHLAKLVLTLLKGDALHVQLASDWKVDNVERSNVDLDLT